MTCVGAMSLLDPSQTHRRVERVHTCTRRQIDGASHKCLYQSLAPRGVRLVMNESPLLLGGLGGFSSPGNPLDVVAILSFETSLKSFP